MDLSTYEACMEAYKLSLTIDQKFQDGRSVWIDEPGVKMICSLLNPDLTVLEFGSGGSTTLFSPFVKHWTSIEHNQYWAETVSLYSVPNDLPFKGDGDETEFESYLKFPGSLGQQYDMIMDDGRARVAVGKYALEQRLFSSESSRLIIHDWERPKYRPVVSQLGYRLEKEDRESRRHMACLLPPRKYKPQSL